MNSKNDLFEYFLWKIINWHCSLYEIAIADFNDHISNNYSKLKIIKLHFFACSTSDEALDIFNDFYAMPYGHVESTVNDGIDLLNNFIITDNSLIIKDVTKTNYNLDEYHTSLIEDLINLLKLENKSILKMRAFDLVELSHRWFSWQYTFEQARKMQLFSKHISPKLIKEETKTYIL